MRRALLLAACVCALVAGCASPKAALKDAAPRGGAAFADESNRSADSSPAGPEQASARDPALPTPPAQGEGAAEGQLVSALRDEYRALGHIQSVLGWYEATQGEKPLTALTYTGHERLFTRSTLDALSRAQEKPGLSSHEQLALRFLKRALAGETVALATAGLDDAVSRAEAEALVTVPFFDKPVPYRNLSILLAGEPDPQRRAALARAQAQVVEEQLNPLLERKEAAAQEAARKSGFADYVALSEELRAVKLSELLPQGVEYVRNTQALYEKTLDRVAREELGVPRLQLRRSDLDRLWKGPRLEVHFALGRELKVLRSFLAGIGLDLRTAAGTFVQIDDALTDKKRPRAFVNPVDAPSDVRLSVKPVGGLDDYWTLFHEAGHAVHFASATIGPSELVNLGHGAPSEAFGEFFRHAFSDAHWLRRYRALLVDLGAAPPTDRELSAVLRRTALVEMMYLRRYAFAKIAYELRLHGRPRSEIAPALPLLPDAARTEGETPAALRELYRQLFSVGLGIDLTDEDAVRFRSDVDDTFYAADYARCFALAGMMHEGIRRKFGDDWYGNKAVGAFLREQLFSQGEALSAEEVAQRLGFAPRVDFALSARRAARLIEEADALEGGAR